jgi:hypothetical protein
MVKLCMKAQHRNTMTRLWNSQEMRERFVVVEHYNEPALVEEFLREGIQIAILGNG